MIKKNISSEGSDDVTLIEIGNDHSSVHMKNGITPDGFIGIMLKTCKKSGKFRHWKPKKRESLDYFKPEAIIKFKKAEDIDHLIMYLKECKTMMLTDDFKNL